MPINKIEQITTDNKPIVLYSRKLDFQTLRDIETNVRTIHNKHLDFNGYIYRDPNDFVTHYLSPVTYYRIVVVAFDKKGYKSAVWERSVLISGTSGAKIVGEPASILTQKENAGLNCEFITEGNDFIVRATGLVDTNVCWIASIEKII